MSQPMKKMINLESTGVNELSQDASLVNMRAMNIMVDMAVVFDDSYSMEKEYLENHVQLIAERFLAMAIAFDYDKKIDVYTLNRGYIGQMTLDNFKDYVTKNIKVDPGGTPYSRALGEIFGTVNRNAMANAVNNFAQQTNEIVKTKTLSFIDKIKSFFNPSYAANPELKPIANETYEKVKVGTQRTKLVYFITDGECTDQQATTSLVASRIGNCSFPLFIQFVGLGEVSFDYLKNLCKGNDNMDFFRMPCPDEEPVLDSWLYAQITKPVTKWYKNRNQNKNQNHGNG